MQLLATSIATWDDTMMRFIFQFAFLHLQLQGFSNSASQGFGLVTPDPLNSPCGWGLGTRLVEISEGT